MCFEPDEEAAVLLVLREKRQWPAFEGTDASIGSKGFRSMGHHERSAPLSLLLEAALTRA